jgi:1,4-alpha-glucan branching enzyme
MKQSYKVIFSLLLVSLYYHSGFAQVVTTVPIFPTVQDSVVVTFHADKGDGGLAGYTGDVYAHTGVITNKASGWSYVIAAWDQNIAKAKMTRVATDTYQLTIPDIRKYYGITDTTEIVKDLAFVFRNSDGSLTGRDVGGADIFVPVYQPGIHVKFTNPVTNDIFLKKDSTLNVVGHCVLMGSGSINLRLFVNGTLVKTVSTDSLLYTITASGYGNYPVTLIGSDGNGHSDTTSFNYIVNPPIVNQARPPGIEDGINYDPADPTTATLSLFAPHKKFVYVIGDFNNWQIDPNYYMNCDSVNADSVYYWITLHNLIPGTKYAFQYLVDGELRIADPYTHEILDPNNDKYISSSTYPNLKPYPAGKTDHIVGTLQTDQANFQWHDSNYIKPKKNNLVIYELLIRDFVANHDYKTLADTLGYLQRLGVNAIELMPITEFEGNDSWGYNPIFYFAPDKYYGPAVDLKQFVDACHQKGIAVIMDMVLNHSYGQSPMVRMYFTNGHPSVDNPWFNQTSPNPNYSWGYDFNHESKATQYFVDRVLSYWIKDYHVDGYRFDFAKGFTNTTGDGYAYDASRIKILEQYADHIWQTDSTAYDILELFTDNSEENELSNYGMMIWGNENTNYCQAGMSYADGPSGTGWTWDLSGASYQNRGWQNPNLVAYMESHDEERVMYKELQYGNSSGNYNIQNLSTALDRIKEDAAFFFTIPGPKMIWQFEEMGYDYSIDFNGRVTKKPIRWDYLDQINRVKLNKVFSTLIKLKEKYPVFQTTDYKINVSGALKQIQLNDTSMDVNIIGNFDVVSHPMPPGFQHTGTWYDYFTGSSVDVTSNQQSINLLPGEFHIYTSKTLPVPEQGILTGITDKVNPSTGVPQKFELEQNYPNPFNPTTNITYKLASSSNVRLEIYNVLGQRVASLVNKKQQAAGEYTVTFKANHLSSGLYLARLITNNHVFVKKMMLLK